MLIMPVMAPFLTEVGAAAFAPDRRVTDPRRTFVRLCVGGAFVLAAAGIVLFAVRRI